MEFNSILTIAITVIVIVWILSKSKNIVHLKIGYNSIDGFFIKIDNKK